MKIKNWLQGIEIACRSESRVCGTCSAARRFPMRETEKEGVDGYHKW